MVWNKVKDNPPPLDKYLLVIRKVNKKYIVLKCRKDFHSGDFMWFTQQNIVHPIDNEDYWMEFVYLPQNFMNESKS